MAESENSRLTLRARSARESPRRAISIRPNVRVGDGNSRASTEPFTSTVRPVMRLA
jgi:hypothetical protein